MNKRKNNDNDDNGQLINTELWKNGLWISGYPCLHIMNVFICIVDTVCNKVTDTREICIYELTQTDVGNVHLGIFSTFSQGTKKKRREWQVE